MWLNSGQWALRQISCSRNLPKGAGTLPLPPFSSSLFSLLALQPVANYKGEGAQVPEHFVKLNCETRRRRSTSGLLCKRNRTLSCLNPCHFRFLLLTIETNPNINSFLAGLLWVAIRQVPGVMPSTQSVTKKKKMNVALIIFLLITIIKATPTYLLG